ncbi:MAG: amidohydrolase family protein [Spirochaetales bacterium]|nr:amidohydrolase family protein [Spirochaetales bacterium]
MEKYKTIDSHIHCGIQNVALEYEIIRPLLEAADIDAACMFAPVEDIYDRDDPDFVDTPAWQECRSRANNYLKGLASRHHVYPYFFVWNDFNVKELTDEFKGIKWHRHNLEPEYHYDDPLCEEFLTKVFERNLPIVLEEEFRNTMNLLERINGRTPVIIPHLGMLNGGYDVIKKTGIWKQDTVYADSALAYSSDIKDFIETYGCRKLIFGSDFPFGIPENEKKKILDLVIRDEEKELILSGNILTLLHIAEVQ